MMHSSLFEAPADPTRRRILEVLAGERSVVDLCPSGASQRLGVLEETGFVSVWPDGPSKGVGRSALAGHRQVWESRLEGLGVDLEPEPKHKEKQP